MRDSELIIAVKGAGEMATGVAVALFSAGFKRIVMFEKPLPFAVRRTVAFCEAIPEGKQTVEGICGLRINSEAELLEAWKKDCIGICADPSWELLKKIKPQVLIDATIAKRNLGTTKSDAPLVIGLGPGFTADKDVHVVIETQRGHNLGRMIDNGSAAPNTSEPEMVMGHTYSRVLRAPKAGVVKALKQIGDLVTKDEIVMYIDELPVTATISGVLRGAIASGLNVPQNCKIGDIDPRNNPEYCFFVSDKARSLGGAVLTALCRWKNTVNI
ncbi:selenium-dependent molybdenum cofactor biosynthesis protein YqeB [Desulfovibrio litoralis]|uniref:Xanthine dehydrogenase accessory factor n=1 Tax=Desulfovibrio litoralis DSM 11393 TaxID=1121455 RepID=A0A1M7TJ50_9BACT|nr:selenium-dependent molybdenum cofactor biosynthesis protein YqeB [Desulfovibrio litoralis]SHN70764.1 xanthine dehydrogenase accessory factor [Desulfovibrio litoralis DSM 11393]